MGKSNRLKSDFSFRDLLEAHQTKIMMETNCHSIGTIRAFNAVTQTAQISINYLKTFNVTDQKTGKYSTENKEYPLLLGCPVVFLRGGIYSLTMPVAVGDECLVFFNDRDIDQWYASGNTAELPTPRLHSLSDAIALVGIRSKPKAITGFDGSRAKLGSATNFVAVGASGVELKSATCGIKVEQKIKLNNQLTTLLTELKFLTQTLSTVLSGPTQTPGNPISPGAAALLAAVDVRLGTLLE